jgi:hypothetical protein
MIPIAAVGFALVLSAFSGDDDTLLGRTFSMGFDTQEQCEQRLAEALAIPDPLGHLRFEGQCVPVDQLQRVLKEERTDNGDVWER